MPHVEEQGAFLERVEVFVETVDCLRRACQRLRSTLRTGPRYREVI
jgi:hypothetical protein